MNGLAPALNQPMTGLASRHGFHMPAAPHSLSLMPHRDYGGSVQPTPGLEPSNQTASPIEQGYMQRFAAMSPEQLQELIARYGNHPLASIAQRVLQQKRIMPSQSAAAPVTQQPSSQGVGMQPVQQAARGGQAPAPKKDTVPILAAGGEFVVSPEHVASLGKGDVAAGHKWLDHFVVTKRKEIIAEMRKLKPPVKS